MCCLIARYRMEETPESLHPARVAFAEALGSAIDIYGHRPTDGSVGWDRFPTYKGPAPGDKLRTLRRYRFNLAFENSDLPGYVTEKLLDALKGGCVPLYIGGDGYLDDTVPAACYVDCRSTDPAEIVERVAAMSADEVLEYRRAGADFLESSAADRYTHDYFADRIIARLKGQT